MKENYRLVIEYLKSLGATVTESTGKAAIQLTEQLDRQFMNRPFYWHYRDAVHQHGDPLRIIITDSPGTESHKDIIQIYPDHPIFRSIFQSAQQENRYFLAYENGGTGSDLYPWITTYQTAEVVPPASASIRFDGRISLTTGRIIINDPEGIKHTLTADRPNGSNLHVNKVPYETSLNLLNRQLERYIEKQFTKKVETLQLHKDYPSVYIQTYHISAGLVYLCSP